MSVLNVGRSVECVYRKGQGSGCLANLDLTNPVYVADNTAVTTSSDQIPALGSIIVDGSRDIYASTQAATVLQLQSMPGVTNWAPSPAQVAAQINAIGLATAANQATQNNTAVATNNVLGTGIALPVGAALEVGNLQTTRQLLAGTSAGALVGVPGNTLAKEIAAWLAGGAVGAAPGGVPLLHGWSRITSQTDSLAAGAQKTDTWNFTNPGYFLAIWPLYQATAGVIPFVTVNMTWIDPNNGQTIAQEHWTLPVSTGAFQPVYGKGPVKSPQLQITFINNDTGQPIFVPYELTQTTHHINRDDWRGGSPVSTPTYLGAVSSVGDPFGLVLASEGSVGAPVLIPASSAKSYLLPLYSGQVQFTLQQINAPQSLNITITPIDPGAGTLAPLYLVLATSATYISPIALSLPRCPCILGITNNSATTQAGIAAYVSALEFAS